MKLKTIANIYSGVTIRTKVRNDIAGDTYVIQMRNINAAFTKIEKQPHKVNNSFPEYSFLQKGDVLFMAKGPNNYAIPYDGALGKAVAVSFFFVLRPLPNLDSTYLAWYINSPFGQRQIHRGKEGTKITSITKRTLSDLKIQLPPLRQQKQIAMIYQLQLKEKELIQQIQEKRSLLVEQQLGAFIKHENEKYHAPR